MLAGVAFNEPRALLLSVASVAEASWLLLPTRDHQALGSERTVTQIATVTLALLAVAAVLRSTPVTQGTPIPNARPHLTNRRV